MLKTVTASGHIHHARAELAKATGAAQPKPLRMRRADYANGAPHENHYTKNRYGEKRMRKTDTVKTVTPVTRWLMAFCDGSTREVKAKTFEAACKRSAKHGSVDIANCKRLRHVELTTELSAKKRAAVLKRYEGKDRIKYKTIRLSEHAVELIRIDAKQRGISASQAVVFAISHSTFTRPPENTH